MLPRGSGSLFDLVGTGVETTPGIDWDALAQGAAPACLGRLKMPIAHLSIQVEWLHRQVELARGRQARVRGTYKRRRSRRRHAHKTRGKPAKTPEQLATAKAKRAAYMRAKRAEHRHALEEIRRRIKDGTTDRLLAAAKERREMRKLRKQMKDDRRRGIF